MAATCPITSSTAASFAAAAGRPYGPAGFDAAASLYGPAAGFESAKYAGLFNRDAAFAAASPLAGDVSSFGYGYPSWTEASRFGGAYTNPWTAGFNRSFAGPWSNWSNTWSSPAGAWSNSWNYPAGANAWSTGYPSSWAATGAGYTSPLSAGCPYTSNLYNVGFRPASAIEYYSLTNPIRVLDREGNRQLWLCYDLNGFKSEEITVTWNKAERAVIVEASHDVKEAKEHQVTRKFYRKFVLPESLAKADLSKIELRSSLNYEGLLTIECSLPKMSSDEVAKCPLMSKAVYSPAGYYGYYGCPSSCNVAPINCKIN